MQIIFISTESKLLGRFRPPAHRDLTIYFMARAIGETHTSNIAMIDFLLELKKQNRRIPIEDVHETIKNGLAKLQHNKKSDDDRPSAPPPASNGNGSTPRPHAA